MRRSPQSLTPIAPAVLATPGAAAAAPLTFTGVFFDADPVVKLIVVGLLIVSIAAVVVCIRKLASGSRLAGGSAFIAGLRYGGPMAGFLGACYTGLAIFVGITNAPPADLPLKVIAPGLAEVTLLALLGLLAGAVAVICHWAIEARIDRTVLRS